MNDIFSIFESNFDFDEEQGKGEYGGHISTKKSTVFKCKIKELYLRSGNDLKAGDLKCSKCTHAKENR